MLGLVCGNESQRIWDWEWDCFFGLAPGLVFRAGCWSAEKTEYRCASYKSKAQRIASLIALTVRASNRPRFSNNSWYS
jgi:hypothetical protein